MILTFAPSWPNGAFLQSVQRRAFSQWCAEVRSLFVPNGTHKKTCVNYPIIVNIDEELVVFFSLVFLLFACEWWLMMRRNLMRRFVMVNCRRKRNEDAHEQKLHGRGTTTIKRNENISGNLNRLHFEFPLFDFAFLFDVDAIIFNSFPLNMRASHIHTI